MRHAHQRMLCALVLHGYDQLHDQATLTGQVQQSGKSRIIQLVALIIRMQPNPGQLVNLVAAAQIFLPVRQPGIYGSKRHQYPMPVLAAVLR